MDRRQVVGQGASAVAIALLGHQRLAFAELPNSRTPPGSAALGRLSAALNGRLIVPDAPDYDSARLTFNRAFDHRPALIARCASASDVVRCLDFARTFDLPVAVRGGGHSRAGFSSCEGGAVIDLSSMRRVEVNASAGFADAQAGARVSDMDEATRSSGLATPTGGCPDVGMAGFTLGGGQGLLMTLHGAGCDNLLSAHVVLPDGRQVDASEEENPDLFWGLRGGGGNFGIVTALRYRLYPVGNVIAGALTYPPSQTEEELLRFARFHESAPDEAPPLAELLPTPDGPVFVNHFRCFGDERLAAELLKPLRSAPKPARGEVRTTCYFADQAKGFRPAPFKHFAANVFVPRLSPEACAVIASAADDAPPRFRVLFVGFLGAITRVKASDTAFPLRQRGVEVDMLCGWEADEDREAAVRWVRSLRDRLLPFAHGVYANQTSETSDALVKAIYASNYDRLAELKRRYDPTDVLRLNQNVKPA